MKGKGTNSRYLLTLLLATNYFHYNFTNLSFAACFVPLTVYNSCTIRPYKIDELSKKIEDIRNHHFGGYYNYAQKGVGNIPLYENDISFDFFYEILKWCDENIQSNNERKNIVYAEGIESESLTSELSTIFRTPDLLWKENKEILPEAKERLLEDLEKYSNKFVIAELLWGIISRRYILPDVKSNCESRLFCPNVYMCRFDENDDILDKLYEHLPECDIMRIAILYLSAASPEGICKINAETTKIISTILNGDSITFVEILVSTYGLARELQDLAFQDIIELKKIYSKNLSVKITREYLPFEVVIAESKDGRMGLAKIDIFSPLSKSEDRSILYISRNDNLAMFEHFRSIFVKVWQNYRTYMPRWG